MLLPQLVDKVEYHNFYSCFFFLNIVANRGAIFLKVKVQSTHDQMKSATLQMITIRENLPQISTITGLNQDFYSCLFLFIHFSGILLQRQTVINIWTAVASFKKADQTSFDWNLMICWHRILKVGPVIVKKAEYSIKLTQTRAFSKQSYCFIMFCHFGFNL